MAEPVEPTDVEGGAEADAERHGLVSRAVTAPALAVLAVVALVVGYLMIGIEGALVAPAAVAVGWTWRREPGRPVATVGAVLLALAGLATVLEATPDAAAAGMTFPRVRPMAVWLAALAGTLLAVSVVVFAYTDQARRPAPRRPVVRWPSWLRPDDAVARLVRTVRSVAPWVGLGVAAVAIRIVASPTRVTADLADLVGNLRFGTIYSSRPLWEGPTASIPPLPAGLLAYGPFGARLAVVVASVTAGAVACRLAWVQLGRRGALATGVVAVLLPSLWSQPLAMVLAAGAVTGAVALADPDRIDVRRAALAGAAAGAAMLCAPDAVVVVPVLVAWLALTTGRSAVRTGLALVAGAVLVASPWWIYVAGRVGVPLPAASWSSFVVEDLATPSLPLVGSVLVGAAVLAVTARILGEARDAWRHLLPFIALPAWNLVLAVVTLGDRDVLGWSAPLVAVVLGSALSGWYEEATAGVRADDAGEHLFA